MFDDDTGTVFRGGVTLALAGFVAIVILLLPWINPPGKDAAAEVDLQGDVMVEATWEGGLDIDVDQWVEAPRLRPVGYSNKSGEACNLLRDDLGRDVDPSPANHEVTICRGIRTNGEYVVNLHLYRNRLDLPLPLPVEVRVTVRENPTFVWVHVKMLPGYNWWTCPATNVLRRLVDDALKPYGYKRDGARGAYPVTTGWGFRYPTKVA